jgi:hypothetical protein
MEVSVTHVTGYGCEQLVFFYDFLQRRQEFSRCFGGTTKSSMYGAVCLSFTLLRSIWKL